MNEKKINNNNQLICQHCLNPIEREIEEYFCPACGMSYHLICWEKANGCSVLSCSQRNIMLNPLFQSSIPVRELLIQIEYLLNLKKYNEAISECNRILSAEKNNLEAKVYYNRAVSAMNVKMKIYESAEESYKRKEYKASVMFLNDYLNYCDKEEGEYIHSRIKYLDELLPTLKRKKAMLSSLYMLITLVILISAGFLVYRFVYLKEDTEYSEIESYDDFSDLKMLETQIVKYEKFLDKYPEGKYKEKATEKIRKISSLIADQICDRDWRTAFVYLKKLNSKEIPLTYNDIYVKIVNKANYELNTLKKEAKEFDSKKKYPEAKDKIEKCIALLDNFPEPEFIKTKQLLFDSKNLINKKIGLLVKSRDIEKEITVKTNELKTSEPEFDFNNLFQIAGKVLKKSGEYYIIKSFEDKKLYALKNPPDKYETGEDVVVSGIKKGKVEITDDASNTMILPVLYDFSGINSGNNSNLKENIIQRLQYLKFQKDKIDSLLNTGI